MHAIDLEKWDARTVRFADRELSANSLLNTTDKNFEDSGHCRFTRLVELIILQKVVLVHLVS